MIEIKEIEFKELDQNGKEPENQADEKYMRYLNHNCAPSNRGYIYIFLEIDGYIAMSDTVFEEKSNQPFYDLVASFEGDAPDILIIGWGLGFIFEKIFTLKPNANVTVVEKYQEVVDLSPYTENTIELNIKDVNELNEYQPNSFDIVYFDAFGEYTSKEYLQSLLKENGTYIEFKGVQC